MRYKSTMNRYPLIFALLVAISSLHGQQKKSLTLEDIYASDKFAGQQVTNIQWAADGSAFTFMKKGKKSDLLKVVYRFEVENGKETVILDSSTLEYNGKQVEMSEYRITRDGHYVLIAGPKEQIWRHSFKAPYYLYHIAEKQLIPLADNVPELMNVALSPDGHQVAYVHDSNLFVADVRTGKERALTFDGSADVLNGVFDWVYEEEFGRADAFRWSPDSRKIAYWHTDQTRVKLFTLLDEMSFYTVPIGLRYPKVGEQNAIVRIGVIEVDSGSNTWMDIGDNDDIYIPRIDWADSSTILAIQRLNRKQNKLELLLADVGSGKSSIVVTDTSATWVDVTDDFLFLKKRKQFVWTSERSGFRHVYLTDYGGSNSQQLTRGDWEVSSIVGVDEKEGWVYFYGGKDSPIEQYIYRIRLDGGDFQRISEKGGWHAGKFSPDYRYFVHFRSDVTTPTQVTVQGCDGSFVRMVEENKIDALDDYNMVYPEFMTVETADNISLNAYMIKPADFDPEKKYPVIVFGYGGPGSQLVVNRWGGRRGVWHQLLTEKGYIIFCLDNRGTGGRGKAFKDLAYGDISKWAVNDQIEGAKYLATLPYVDASRIGFWGWSGGGYLTCMLMTRGSDYFRTGVAVAPVTDFRNYDTIWTERYMGLLSENRAGYDAANVNNYADMLRGNLLIIHGTGDDNVHPENTMQFVNELIAQNKQFSLMLYPNRNHRISGGNTQLHLFTLITNYFLEKL